MFFTRFRSSLIIVVAALFLVSVVAGPGQAAVSAAERLLCATALALGATFTSWVVTACANGEAIALITAAVGSGALVNFMVAGAVVGTAFLGVEAIIAMVDWYKSKLALEYPPYSLGGWGHSVVQFKPDGTTYGFSIPTTTDGAGHYAFFLGAPSPMWYWNMNGPAPPYSYASEDQALADGRKKAEYVLGSGKVYFDPAIGTTRRLVHVVLLRVEHVFHLPTEPPERHEVLLVVGRRAAADGLRLEHQQRRVHRCHVAQRRLPP